MSKREQKKLQRMLKGRGCRRRTGVYPGRGKGRTTRSKR